MSGASAPEARPAAGRSPRALAGPLRAAAATLGCAVAIGSSWGCSDPVHDDTVAALGPENSQVPPGPTHRPGQPCLTCHGGSGPASRQFSLGGTVYAVAGLTAPAAGALVQIEDIDGRVSSIATNAAGNFFVALGDFTPHYPIQMKVWSADGKTMQKMQSLAAREGSCAGCHVNPQGPKSPGPVYVSATAPDGGGP